MIDNKQFEPTQYNRSAIQLLVHDFIAYSILHGVKLHTMGYQF